jgi:hypothetical protein
MEITCRVNYLEKHKPMKVCEHTILNLHRVPTSEESEYSARLVISCKVCCEDFILRLLVN